MTRAKTLWDKDTLSITIYNGGADLLFQLVRFVRARKYGLSTSRRKKVSSTQIFLYL